MTDGLACDMLVNIQNNTDKVMATNIFNMEEYVWDEDSRPNTSLHERVIYPHTEITEPSRINALSGASSYHLGLTISDGSYLRLTVDHGVMGVHECDPTQAEPEREVCQVAGSLDKFTVERCMTGVAPTTLVVRVFDKAHTTDSEPAHRC